MSKINEKKIVAYLFYTVVIFLFIFIILIVSTNHEYYKQTIDKNIRIYTENQLKFSHIEYKFFPFPALVIHKVEYDSEEISFKSDSMEFRFYIFKLLSKELNLRKVNITNLYIHLISKADKKKQKQKSSLNISNTQFINKFNISEIAINRIRIKSNLFDEELEFVNTKYDTRYLSLPQLSTRLKYKNGILEMNGQFRDMFLENFDLTYFDFKFNFSNFSVSIFKEYFYVFPSADYKNTRITGDIRIKKEKGQPKITFQIDTTISKLKFKGGTEFEPIEFKGQITYNYKLKEIDFVHAEAYSPKIANGKASGKLDFKRNFLLTMDIEGEYAHIFQLVEVIVLFVDIYVKEPSPFDVIAKLNIKSKKAYFEDFEFINPKVFLNLKNENIQMDIHSELLGGKANSKGSIIVGKTLDIDFQTQTYGVDLKSLLDKYVEKQLITGTMDSNVRFRYKGKPESFDLSKTVWNGDLKIFNGELFGYVDFYNPILSIGKVINFAGPSGSNTGFKELFSKFQIDYGLITIHDLNLIGVGMDAYGLGKVHFNGDIDFKLTVSLGGIAGKVLKIPVLFQGKVPDNAAMIDPVWLASVYVGNTFLPGIGTAVGGVLGSTVSDYTDILMKKFKLYLKTKDDSTK